VRALPKGRGCAHHYFVQNTTLTSFVEGAKIIGIKKREGPGMKLNVNIHMIENAADLPLLFCF